MGDTKPLEFEAESLVTHLLIKHGFKVCKPSFDQYGADLLILDSLDENPTPYLKVQSKGRTVTITNRNTVSIPIDYVDEKFIFFLYTKDDSFKENTYVFFKQDIELWAKGYKEYSLSLSIKNLSLHSHRLFSVEIAGRIRRLLKEQTPKKYTSLIIDGIFLEKAVSVSRNLYRNIYPAKQFKEMILEDLVGKILKSYNRFKSTDPIVNVVLYNSQHHSLNTEVILPENSYFQSQLLPNVKIFINHTEDIVSFSILEHIERIINAENVILVANDIAYESPLLQLKNKGVEVILVTLQEELGGQIFAGCTWGDIVYPIGLALGLDFNEI